MVKKPGSPISRRASLASRLSTRTARISPAGGVSSPNRLRSALLNGRCHAKPRSPTIHVRWPHFVATVTPGRLIANVSTSANVMEMPRLSHYKSVTPLGARQVFAQTQRQSPDLLEALPVGAPHAYLGFPSSEVDHNISHGWRPLALPLGCYSVVVGTASRSYPRLTGAKM